MVKITYIDAEGTARTVEAEEGSTVMENAVRNGIPGIEAECGGACACATCHVYVDEEWRAATGEPQPMEEDMLDFAADVRPNSRLSCQPVARPSLRRQAGRSRSGGPAHVQDDPGSRRYPRRRHRAPGARPGDRPRRGVGGHGAPRAR